MRVSAINFLTNTSIMMSNLFIPVLAFNLGASGIQIGIIGSIYGASLFISSYIFSRASTSYSPKILLYSGLGISAITFFLQMFAHDPFSLGILRSLAGFSVGMYPAVLILYAYNLKRSIEKFTSFMPLGWAFGNLTAGIVAVEYQIFFLSSLFFAISFLIALKLPDIEVQNINKVNFLSTDILKKNWQIYLGFFLRQIGANNVWIIFPLYLISIGADKLWVGIIYITNPLLQFFIMRNLSKYDNKFLIHIGDMLSVVAFIILIPITIYYQAIIGMILIAFSFSCLYIGSTKELIESNQNKGEAAGLLNSVSSLSSVIGSLLGGFILDFFGYHANLITAAALAFLGYIAMQSKYFNKK